MNRSRDLVVMFRILALGLLVAACGGGSGNNPPPASISVAITNPPASVVVGGTASFTAVVTNDSTGAGVTWAVSCGGSACGSVSPTSTKGNSGTTTYTAPAAVPTGNTVTITATSVADTTKSASATVTITATAAISVTISNPPTSLVMGTSTTLTAVVSEDSKAAGVTWTVACGSAACGSFNPTTSSGNTATTTYTAPGVIPTGNTVTVTATSVSDNTKSASATITITATPPAVLANGNYVYRMSGENANGPYFVVGAFTVSNGSITGGEQDFLDPVSGQTDTLVPSNSSLTTVSNGNIQIVLATGDPNVGANGVETFRGTLVSGTHAQITEFDTSAAAGGTLDLQTSTAAPSGGYAFNLGGIDGTTNANALFLGGVIDISGTTINVANSEFDYFDGGTVGQDQTFSSGTVSSPDSFGRITISLTASQVSGGTQFAVSGYIVGPNRIQLVESPNDNLGGTLGGTALGQGSNTGNFAAAGVGGQTYVFAAAGIDYVNGTATFAGVFALNTNGTVSGNFAYADAGGNQGLTISGGSWTIDSLGRVALSNVTVSGQSNIGSGPFAFQLYLDGNGNALEVGTDAIQGTTGPSYLQTASQVNAGKYAIGAQGFAGVQALPVWTAVGPVTLDSSLNWTGFTDYNVFSGTPETSVILSGTTNTSEGLFSITGLNAISPTPATPEFGYFPIDNARVLAIEVDNNQLGLFLIESISQ